MGEIIDRAFYLRDGLEVAKELLGMVLCRTIDDKVYRFKIVETEAYRAPEDKASHAYGNKRTPRTQVMFEEGGIAYIYLIYGMYNCLNVVAQKEGIAHAVLIRALEPLDQEAVELCRRHRVIKSKKIQDLTNGPGKLCQALAIGKALNGHSFTKQGELFIEKGEIPLEIVSAKRINIDYAMEYADKEWRFYVKDNKFVSVL